MCVLRGCTNTEEYLAPEVINAAGHGPGERQGRRDVVLCVAL